MKSKLQTLLDKSPVEWLVDELDALGIFPEKEFFPEKHEKIIQAIGNALHMEEFQKSAAINRAVNVLTSENISRLIDALQSTSKKPVYTEASLLVEWVESDQAREILGVSPGTLQTLRKKGIVSYTKLGGKLKYKKSDLLNILEKDYGKN